MESSGHPGAAAERNVRVQVLRIGETSVSFSFPIADAVGQKRATVRTTHVCIDPAEFRSMPWPPEYRAALSAAGGVPDGSAPQEAS